MAEKKINDDRLLQLIKDGNTPAEAARKLGVGRAAVSKRLKILRVSISKDVSLRSAEALVNRGLNAMSQLQKINDSINAELDRIEEGANGLTGPEREKFQEQRLKHVAEIRKQLAVFADYYQIYANYVETKAFRQALFEAIRECSPEVRAAIDRKLHQINAIPTGFDIGMV